MGIPNESLMLYYAVVTLCVPKLPIYLTSRVLYRDIYYIEISLHNTATHLQVPLVPNLTE